VEVLLVDWDADANSLRDPSLVKIASADGREQSAYVGDLLVQPLELLAGTDVACAIEASRFAFQ